MLGNWEMEKNANNLLMRNNSQQTLFSEQKIIKYKL